MITLIEVVWWCLIVFGAIDVVVLLIVWISNVFSGTNYKLRIFDHNDPKNFIIEERVVGGEVIKSDKQIEKLVEEKKTINFTNGLTFRWNDLDEEIKDLIEIHVQDEFDISAHEIYLNITKKGIQPVSTPEEAENLHNDIQLFLRQGKDGEENE